MGILRVRQLRLLGGDLRKNQSSKGSSGQAQQLVVSCRAESESEIACETAAEYAKKISRGTTQREVSELIRGEYGDLYATALTKEWQGLQDRGVITSVPHLVFLSRGQVTPPGGAQAGVSEK